MWSVLVTLFEPRFCSVVMMVKAMVWGLWWCQLCRPWPQEARVAFRKKKKRIKLQNHRMGVGVCYIPGFVASWEDG